MFDTAAAVYRDEANELLGDLEAALLDLEEYPDDLETVDRVFRAMHTIKGSGAMFGFDGIAGFTHELETTFDLVRSGRMPVTRELINLTLVARDQIKSMLDEGEDSGRERAEVIVASLRRMLPQPGEAPHPVAAVPAPQEELVGQEATWRVRFTPAPRIFANGTNPLGLLRELADLGLCSVHAHADGIPDLGGLEPEACYLQWDVILTTTAGLNAIRDVFIFAEDSCSLRIDPIVGLASGDAAAHRRLGEILVERGDIDPAALEETLAERKRVGEMLVEKGLVSAGTVGAALVEQGHLQQVQERRQPAESVSSVRVTAEKLDALVNQVGELVITQAMLAQMAKGLDPVLFDNLHRGLVQLERNTRVLQESVMSIRMLPIGSVFGRFPRLVRDTAARLGKQVELRLAGENTELDKGLIEKIADPLTHLLRNSLDHGIERPADRAAAGKEPVGTVTLRAYQQGGRIMVEVSDDGAGLNRERILAKARERGLAAPDGMPDEEVWQLIFTPGFSTAETVTDVSGRGVGMDVVLRNVQEMGGRVHIASEAGTGCRFIISLPLTMAVLDGLSVAVGEERYIIPLNAIIESLQPRAEEVSTLAGQRQTVVKIRGDCLPLVRLADLFRLPGAVVRPEAGIVIVIDAEGEKAALLVDDILDEQQVVIKSLEANYRKVPGTAGATILGDGRVALILDLGAVVKMWRRGIEQ